MSYRFRLAFIAASLALLPASGFAQTYDPAWARHDGEITVSDPDNAARPGTKWDLFSLSGVSAGATVRLYMKAGSLQDPYLQITNSSGVVITQDDDSGAGASDGSYHGGNGLDAYVEFTYQPGYQIRATSYSSFASGGAGTYQLYISAGSVIDIGSDTEPPTISSVTSSTANGTYKVGDSISIQVVFSEAVTVTGTPLLTLNSGGTASYTSGSGTTTLTFLYTVAAGHSASDLDYSATNALALSGGTIKDAAGNNGTLTLPTVGGTHSLGGQKAIVIDGVAPTVTSVQVPSNGNYHVGQNLDFTVNFGESVIVNTGGGTPFLTLTLDTGGSVAATYLSGSGSSALVFRYSIQLGNADSNGITIAGSITANGGTLRDAATNNAVLTLSSVGSTASVLVDGVPPTVSSINRYDPSNALTNGTTLVYRVTFSESVSSVDSADFSLTSTGTASGSIASVSANSGTTIDVTVGTVTGDGMLRLDLKASGTGIADTAGNSIASGYSSGQIYTVDTTAPAITSQPVGGTYVAGDAFALTVAASDSTALSYQWYRASTALSNNSNTTGATTPTVTLTHIGTVGFAGDYRVVVTDLAGNQSTSAVATIVVNKAEQTITFPPIEDKLTTSAPFTVSATASTGFPVTFSIESGPATISGATVTITGAGAITVRADQVGDLNYNAASSDQTFSVTKAPATVTFGNLIHTYDGSAKSATTTTDPNGLTVEVTYDGHASAPSHGGSYAVVATINDAQYQGSASATLVVGKASQTITFNSITAPTIGLPIALQATASSALPVTFSVVSGPATIAGTNLTISGGATVVVRASQAGDGNYLAATTDQTITDAAKAAQTITFAPLPDHPATDAPFGLSATASSGLPVSFTIVDGPAILSGSTLSLTAVPGTVVVRASQAGNTTYLAAPDVTQSFAVTAVGPLVYFGILGHGETAHQIAAQLKPDGKAGTMIGIIPGTSEAFVVDFAPGLDGRWTATVTTISGGSSLSVPSAAPLGLDVTALGERFGGVKPATLATFTRTFHGFVSGGVLTGTIDELGLTFTAALQPPVGPTAAVAGYYEAPSLNSATGSTHAIVGTQGQVYVLIITASGIIGHGGSVAANGSFAVPAAEGVSVTGTVSASSTLISGQITLPSGVTEAFSGVRESTLRTDRLINLSTRARVSSSGGFGTLITGFVIGGTAPKEVLLRGVGPTLANFGLFSVLADPRLRVFNGTGQVIAENDNWGGDAVLAATMRRVGAFALPEASLDAALLLTLPPGAYSVHVLNGGQGGIALAEIYDASENPQSEYQRLINISSRGLVTGGDGVLIAGFVVTGNAPKRVLVRGAGPALASYGVSGVLGNPQLSLYDAGGSIIASNDDWETPITVTSAQTSASAAEIVSANTSVGAFALTNGSKDAALVVTLAPGNYTAHVAGVAGATGVALIEIYELAD